MIKPDTKAISKAITEVEKRLFELLKNPRIKNEYAMGRDVTMSANVNGLIVRIQLHQPVTKPVRKVSKKKK